MRKLLYLLIFGDTGRVLALEAEVARLKAALHDKDVELKACMNALFADHGRAPLYDLSVVEENKPNLNEVSLRERKVDDDVDAIAKRDTTPTYNKLSEKLKGTRSPREWASIASQLSREAEKLKDQGLIPVE